jgi:hypothetical protein
MKADIAAKKRPRACVFRYRHALVVSQVLFPPPATSEVVGALIARKTDGPHAEFIVCELYSEDLQLPVAYRRISHDKTYVNQNMQERGGVVSGWQVGRMDAE